jgi:hypothetical protein
MKFWGRSFAYAAVDHKNHRKVVGSTKYNAAARFRQLVKKSKQRSKKKGQFIESGAASDLLEAGSDSQEVATAERGQLQEPSAIDDMENSDETDALFLEDAGEEK